MKRSSPAAESHCTLCSSAVRLEAEQLRDAAVQIAERIGNVAAPARSSSACPARLPARAAAEIAAAVERQHRGFLERRRKERRRRVRRVMLHHHDAAFGKSRRAASDGNPTRGTDAPPRRIHLLGLGAGQLAGTSRWTASGRSPARPNACGAPASIPRSRRPVRRPCRTAHAASPSTPPIPRMTMRYFPPFSRFSILAHVSRSATVRLNTRLAGRGVRIDAEVAQPLELIAAPGAAPASDGSSLRR